ncbi:unnamed protein product [Oikopleura dioica]|uniref:Uncharacterized protein n=1 Tax=Oikopleura dioica TaxID=34765 RepID=E4XIB7_OIKDI|nr:unnamed protein product [Oikopleura dioica]
MSQQVQYVQSPGTVYVHQQGYPQQVVYQQGPPVGRPGGPPVATPVQYVQQPQYQQQQQVVYQQQQQR